MLTNLSGTSRTGSQAQPRQVRRAIVRGRLRPLFKPGSQETRLPLDQTNA